MFSNKIVAALLCIASMCFICSIWIFPSMQHANLYNLRPITSPNEKVVAEFLPDKTAQVLLNFYEQLKAKLLNSKN